MIKYRFYTLLSALCLCSAALLGQNPSPADPQTKPIVIKGATLHIGDGQVLENTAIRFENGLITGIGAEAAEAGAEVIDATGQHVYPGLILPNNILGLSEVGAVRATHDYAEVGDLTPNVRALIAYNTDSEIIPTMRANGILLVQTTPKGGTLSGSSSVMMLDGWNWEDAALHIDDGHHLRWMSQFQWSWEQRKMVKNEGRVQQIAELELFFGEAQQYFKAKPATKNLKMEAMRGVFEGTQNLYIHANTAKEMIEAVLFAKKFGIAKIVLVGAADAHLIVDFLKEHQLPVILNRLHRLPIRDEEGVFVPYQLPKILHEAGIKVALAYDDREPMGARNLPFQAGTAVAYGLDKEAALQMVTANAAEILGVSAFVGTLAKGKQATLVVSGGDLLDMRSNRVTHAFIQGRNIDLDTRHKRLYNMYKTKYGVE
ncbi:amidohydrolase family protein [Eisenibacter elegans]|jgi:imidazolonepropionase-like amidohydrolase|uniref:amidohydrolase family protein n=1 Tax=Eisenibacter elegans TaxID=997 RepID=UPI0004233805|nr:amidohydrolase family protein [Eisenibacter elegans]